MDAETPELPEPLDFTPQHPQAWTAGGYGMPGAEAPPSVLRAAGPFFLIGCLIAIGVSVIGIVTIDHSSQGYLWYGGFFVALGMWFRALRAGRLARSNGGQLSRPTVYLVAAGLVASLGMGVYFAIVWSNGPSSSNMVGSCWPDSGTGDVVSVSCSSPQAKLVATANVTTPGACPTTSVADVQLPGQSTYLCLAQR